MEEDECCCTDLWLEHVCANGGRGWSHWALVQL